MQLRCRSIHGAHIMGPSLLLSRYIGSQVAVQHLKQQNLVDRFGEKVVTAACSRFGFVTAHGVRR